MLSSLARMVRLPYLPFQRSGGKQLRFVASLLRLQYVEYCSPGFCGFLELLEKVVRLPFLRISDVCLQRSQRCKDRRKVLGLGAVHGGGDRCQKLQESKGTLSLERGNKER